MSRENFEKYSVLIVNEYNNESQPTSSCPFSKMNLTKIQLVNYGYGYGHDYGFNKDVSHHGKIKNYHVKWNENDKDKKINILKINVPKYILPTKIIKHLDMVNFFKRSKRV